MRPYRLQVDFTLEIKAGMANLRRRYSSIGESHTFYGMGAVMRRKKADNGIITGLPGDFSFSSGIQLLKSGWIPSVDGSGAIPAPYPENFQVELIRKPPDDF